MEWFAKKWREFIASIPSPTPRQAYNIACGTTLIPIVALLTISIFPCNTEWVHNNLWEVKSGPTLLIFSMILLLVNFAWITDIAIVSRRVSHGFQPLFVFSVAMSTMTSILIVMHIVGNDDFRPDPQPLIFFFFVAFVFSYYAFFRMPPTAHAAPAPAPAAAPERTTGGDGDVAS